MGIYVHLCEPTYVNCANMEGFCRQSHMYCTLLCTFSEMSALTNVPSHFYAHLTIIIIFMMNAILQVGICIRITT